jgi:hypothetical protein
LANNKRLTAGPHHTYKIVALHYSDWFVSKLYGKRLRVSKLYGKRLRVFHMIFTAARKEDLPNFLRVFLSNFLFVDVS